MNHINFLLKVSAVVFWLTTVFLAAKLIENWRINQGYADLLPASAHQVLADQSTIIFDVFALPDSAAAKLVGNFLEPLVGQLKAAEINYLDSSLNPELVQKFNIQKQGEMVIHQGEKNFQLKTLSYETFFNGLKKLNQPKDRWIVFIDNLSSHSFNDSLGSTQSNSYHGWLQRLLAANYQAMVLSWRSQLELPKLAQLIVLAAPSTSLTDEQMQWLQHQISLGKSLLWLTNPRNANVQPALSLLFDVMHTDAIHQGQLVIKEFPDHLINHHFDRPLDFTEVMPFVTANQPLWVNEEGQVLAATQEIQGMNLNLAASRLMVVGDSDFLAGQNLNSGGNLEMSYRMIDWLLQHDDRIDLPGIGMGDTQLHFSANEILWFAGIMLILIPLLLLLIGGYYWRKTK